MGEYDAKQRNQLCTLIVNGNTGSKQLKGFVDNRCTTQKVASQIKVIQKASIDEWCQGVKEAQNPTITLYTYVFSDGSGDAGQLGYLVDKMRFLGYRPIPYANYYPKRKDKTLVDPGPILDLARIDPKVEERRIKTNSNTATSDDKSDGGISIKKTGKRKTELIYKYLRPFDDFDKNNSGWIDECRGSNTWEIQYPVPAQISTLDDKKILKVSEMNIVRDAFTKYHTGIAKAKDGTGIGYGIPKYIPKSDDESNLRDKFIECNIISDSEPDLPCLKDAWLVKVNEGQSVVDILKKAKEMGCTFLILLGGKNVQKDIDQATEKPSKVFPIQELKQSVLSCLMSKIGCDGGTGMIFAGGEGMYVQALGASEAAVGDVIRGGYSYQTEQIKADSEKKAGDENPLNPVVMAFDPKEKLGMMNIPQKVLKEHSDWIRGKPADGPSHNWFDELDKTVMSLKDAEELYLWFKTTQKIPSYFIYLERIINKAKSIRCFDALYRNCNPANDPDKEKIEMEFRNRARHLKGVRRLFENHKLRTVYEWQLRFL